MKSKCYSEENALGTALKYLSRKQMTVFQLARRLEEKGFSVDDSREALSKLSEWKYLDDHHYALAYCKEKGKKLSRARIRRDLGRAGIEKQLILTALEEAYPEEKEYQNCLELGQKMWQIHLEKWEKKKYVKYNNIPKEIILKKRVGEKLVQRGYPFDTIGKVLAEIIEREKI